MEDKQAVLNGLATALQNTKRYKTLQQLHYDPKAEIATASFANREPVLVRIAKLSGDEMISEIMDKLDWMV